VTPEPPEDQHAQEGTAPGGDTHKYSLSLPDGHQSTHWRHAVAYEFTTSTLYGEVSIKSRKNLNDIFIFISVMIE
jgi:hypothetical protein